MPDAGATEGVVAASGQRFGDRDGPRHVVVPSQDLGTGCQATECATFSLEATVQPPAKQDVEDSQVLRKIQYSRSAYIIFETFSLMK